MRARNGGNRDGIGGNPYEAPKSEGGSQGQQSRGWLGQSSSSRSGAPDYQFSFDCDCGRPIGVAPAQAGSLVRCEACGQEVSVPSLSKLRKLSGKDAYESGTADTIRRMIRSGELPADDVCAVSGTPTGETVILEILIPKVFRNQDVERSNNALIFFGGLWAMALVALSGQHKAYATDTDQASTLRVPLRVAEAYHAKVVRMNQRRLRVLLRSVPIYATLLKENPAAQVSVVEEPEDQKVGFASHNSGTREASRGVY